MYHERVAVILIYLLMREYKHYSQTAKINFSPMLNRVSVLTWLIDSVQRELENEPETQSAIFVFELAIMQVSLHNFIV